jgi:glycine/D-amino acid oxidase-like deaminating enzyme
MQEDEGLDLVEVDDLQELLPGAEEEGIAYALYEPNSGFADPVATTRAYIEASRRAGATALEGTPVGGIELANGRVRGVRVGDEVIECDSVVLAAGPWSIALAYGIDLELPLEVTREQDVVYDVGAAPVPPRTISSQTDRVYIRPAPEYGDRHILVGRGYPKEYEQVHPDAFDDTVSDAFEADVRNRVGYRLPELAGMRAVGGRVGLYDVTPDWHPLLGPVDGYEGLFLATGGSGHCFKLGPAIGELVAGAIIGKPASYASVETFSLSRFAEGRALGSSYGGNRA